MLSRLSIRAKLLSGFGVMILLMFIVGGSGLLATTRMQDSVDDLSEDWLPSVLQLGQYRRWALETRQVEAELLLFTDPAERARRRSRVEEADTALREAWQAYEPMATTAEERRIADRIRAAEAGYLRSQREAIRLLDAGDDAAALRIFAAARADFEAFLGAINDAVAFNRRGSVQSGVHAHFVGEWALWGIIGVASLAMLIGVAMALLIARSIASRVGSLAGVMERMARRDYDFELKEAADQDEIGVLARAVDTCRDGLKEADRLTEQQREAEAKAIQRAQRVDALISAFDVEVSDALRTVAAAATELDATAKAMGETADDGTGKATAVAAATEEASVNIQTVASSAEELAASIAEVARQVRDAAGITSRAADAARDTDVTVRGLAESAIQMETTRTVDAIAGIARTIDELNANTGQVAAASEQQAAATQEIGRAVAEAAVGTQEASRNAAGVQQGAERTGAAAGELRGASTELSQQAERLRGRVGTFLAEIRAA